MLVIFRHQPSGRAVGGMTDQRQALLCAAAGVLQQRRNELSVWPCCPTLRLPSVLCTCYWGLSHGGHFLGWRQACSRQSLVQLGSALPLFTCPVMERVLNRRASMLWPQRPSCGGCSPRCPRCASRGLMRVMCHEVLGHIQDCHPSRQARMHARLIATVALMQKTNPDAVCACQCCGV